MLVYPDENNDTQLPEEDPLNLGDLKDFDDSILLKIMKHMPHPKKGMAETNKYFNNLSEDSSLWKKKLAIDFPHALPEEGLGDTPHSVPDYEKIYTKCVELEYSGLTARSKQLLTWFKNGELDKIEQANIAVKDVLSVRDNYGFSLMHWAAINNQRSILDYFIELQRSSTPSESGLISPFDLRYLFRGYKRLMSDETPISQYNAAKLKEYKDTFSQLARYEKKAEVIALLDKALTDDDLPFSNIGNTILSSVKTLLKARRYVLAADILEKIVDKLTIEEHAPFFTDLKSIEGNAFDSFFTSFFEKNVNGLEDKQQKALWSIYCNRTEGLDELFEETPDFVNDTSYQSLLGKAIQCDRREIVEWFLDKGVDHKTRGGVDNLLHMAARVNSPQTVALMIDRGFPVDMSVVNYFEDRSLLTLLTSDISCTSLSLAIEKGFLETVIQLVEKGANLECLSRFFVGSDYSRSFVSTPLGQALHQKKFDIAAYLLTKGANIALSDVIGPWDRKTNLQKEKTVHICRLLIEALTPEQLNKQDKTGYTALDIVCLCGIDELIEPLLEKGAKVSNKVIDAARRFEPADGENKMYYSLEAFLRIKKYVQDRTKHAWHDMSLFGRLSNHLEKTFNGYTLKEDLKAAKALERYAREGYTEEAKRLLRTHHRILVSSRISELYKSVIPKELQEELSILAAQDKITGIKWRS